MPQELLQTILNQTSPVASPTTYGPSLKAAKEDLAELLLKAGGSIPGIDKLMLSGPYIGENATYLKQFTHPDKDILPRTNARPKTIKTNDDLAWRTTEPQEPWMGTGMSGKFVPKTAENPSGIKWG